MTINHEWTDGWGNSRSSEVCASFNRGEFCWVTIWDERASSFRTLPAGPAVLFGNEALLTLTDEEQKTVFELARDLAGDMSSTERAHEVIDGMSIDEMREWLKEDDDLGDDTF